MRRIDAERVKECEGTRQETGEVRKRSYRKLTLPFECVFATMFSLFVAWAFDHKWPMDTFATFPVNII